MAYWKILQLEVDTSFRPGSGQNWNSKKEYQYKDLKAGINVSLEEFEITIDELNEDGMKGNVVWRSGGLRIQAGDFAIGKGKPVYSTPTLNVAYDTLMRLSMQLLTQEAPLEKMKMIIDGLSRNGADVLPPATNEEIAKCNQELLKYKLPTLPKDFSDFMKICSALEFNGMSIFGTYGCQIVEQNEMLRQFYSHQRCKDQLLIFGRIDDDIYSYNATTGKYEARDLNGFEIWDEYESFYAFFFTEMMKWMR